jgi:hypothetical protein
VATSKEMLLIETQSIKILTAFPTSQMLKVSGNRTSAFLDVVLMCFALNLDNMARTSFLSIFAFVQRDWVLYIVRRGDLHLVCTGFAARHAKETLSTESKCS